ncbi:MAG: LysM peptidoglycan-binding domain-containing protein [Tissierellia bacterium]|nr:LysM peptidoglycan-binding domain-containing protein [Tissierellia bacterium]
MVEKISSRKSLKISGMLTKREKRLLLVLILVIVTWLLYRFLITPQLRKLRNLEEEKLSLEGKITNIDHMLAREEKIEEELAKLQADYKNIMDSFFVSLNQAEIINLLGEIFEDSAFEAEDIMFYEPKEEIVGQLTVKTIDVVVPYQGYYDGIVRVLKAISTHPKKILISKVIMDSVEDRLAGSLSLRFYSIEEPVDSEKKIISYYDLIGEIQENPFEPFEDYEDQVLDEDVENGEGIDGIGTVVGGTGEGIGEEAVEVYSRKLLEDFEGGRFDFIPSNIYVKGNVFKSTNSKSNRYSLRLEYSILALEDENRAYINLSNREIYIKYPPSSLGIWIYSYSYSPSTIGIKLIGQNNEEYDISISEGISWVGWQYMELALPLELSIYPLKVDKLYVEMTNYRDDHGVLLFDKLEANYPADSNTQGQFNTFHVVKEGETLRDISLKYYNTTNKVDLIKKYNELESDIITPGRILVIPGQEGSR